MLHQLPAVAAAAAAVTNHKVYGLLQSQTVIRSDALMNLSAVQQRLHLSLSLFHSGLSNLWDQRIR